MRPPLGLEHRSRWFEAVLLVLVAATVVAVHWPVLRAQGTAMDDAQFVTANPLVSHPGWHSVERFFGEVLRPSTVGGYYLPLSMTSLMVDWAMGGRPDDLGAFHRTSLLLHVLCTVLIVLILRRLFGSIVPAAAVGLIFGLHPMTVEPVAWVGERKTLLAAFFALASILTYLEHLGGRKKRTWLGVSLGLYVLALVSKPTVTLLPIMLLLLDWWPLDRLRRAAVIEKWPYAALSLVSGVITFISHERTAQVVMPTAVSALTWPFEACYLLAFYLRKIVWPSNLSSVYPHPPVFSLAVPSVLASVFAIAALTILVLAIAPRTRGPLAGWLLFVIGLGPTLGLIKFSWVIASDKYIYFPALGLLAVLAAGGSRVWESLRRGGRLRRALWPALFLFIVSAEAVGTRITVGHWKNDLTLYRHMEKIAPDSPIVQDMLGGVLGAQVSHAEALPHFEKALELWPDYMEAHYNLGILLLAEGKMDDAIQHFQKALQLSPDDPQAAFGLGSALCLRGRNEEGVQEFQKALSLDPGYVEASNHLGRALTTLGRTEEAIGVYRKAIEGAPSDPELHVGLAATLLQTTGPVTAAEEELRTAIRCKSDWMAPCNQLAWLLATNTDPALRDGSEAVRLADRADSLAGGHDPDVLDTRAAAEAAAGRFEQAEQTAETAIELARTAHSDSLADAIGQRLQFYRQRRIYTEIINAPGGAASPAATLGGPAGSSTAFAR